MNNELDLFHRIIFGDIRPWIGTGVHDDKYKQLASEIKKETPAFTAFYKVDFLKPFNPKTKYYHALITNETVRYLNVVSQLVAEADKETLKIFWVNTTLTKKVASKLKDLIQVIHLQDYEFQYIDTAKPISHNNAQHKANTFIFQLLKVELVYIYLEIQKAFQQHVKGDVLEIEDVYMSFLNENVPNQSYITVAIGAIASTAQEPASEYKPLATVHKQTEEPDKPAFVPFKGDIQREKRNKSKFIFDDVKDPNLFLQFEALLYEYDFINNEYSYIEDHGRKTELAAIYKVLISKNYFRPKGVRRSKYEPYHYRQFLDHRYNTDVAYQFKTITPEQIDVVTSKYHWLHSLPVCR